MFAFSLKCIDNNILHGDFHTGNFLFRIKNNSLKMIVFDFGIVVNVNNIEKTYFFKMFDYESDKDEYIKNTNEFFKYLGMDPIIDIDLFNTKASKKISMKDRINLKTSKIPINFISIATLYPHLVSFMGNLNRTLFLIKFYNYVFKNKFRLDRN